MRYLLFAIGMLLCGYLIGSHVNEDKVSAQMEEQYRIALSAVDLAELRTEQLKVCTEALNGLHQHGIKGRE